MSHIRTSELEVGTCTTSDGRQNHRRCHVLSTPSATNIYRAHPTSLFPNPSRTTRNENENEEAVLAAPNKTKTTGSKRPATGPGSRVECRVKNPESRISRHPTTTTHVYIIIIERANPGGARSKHQAPSNSDVTSERRRGLSALSLFSFCFLFFGL